MAVKPKRVKTISYPIPRGIALFISKNKLEKYGNYKQEETCLTKALIICTDLRTYAELSNL